MRDRPGRSDGQRPPSRRSPSGGEDRQPRSRADGRGLSSIVAIVLLLGIVVVGSIGILLLGGSAVSDNQDTAEDERVAVAFRTLDSEMDAVAREEASSREVDVDALDDRGGAVREVDSGRMVVTRTNITAGNTDELVNRSLGAIVYATEDRHYGIQAGGVWRGTGNGTQMVSAPPVTYSTTEYGTEPTLTIPLVETAGDRRLVDDQVRITHNDTVSPLNDVSVVEGDLITVRITSQYYVGWGEHFRQITNEAAVEYDHANETVIVELIVPAVAPPVAGGVVTGATAETLKLKQYAEIDSYNSSNGSYASTAGAGGRVIAGGDVEMQQNSAIRGSLELRGDGTFRQDSRIYGNFSYSQSSSLTNQSDLSTHVTGWYANNSTVGERTAVDGVIDRNVLLVRENNDNASTSAISNGQLQNCASASGCELTSGAYYLNEIDLDNSDTLVLNTSGGQIYLVVRNQVQLSDDAQIEVQGPGRANIYIDSETGSEDFSLKNDATVSVPGNRAPGLWVYMDSDAEVKFRQRVNFTGVVYGPGPGPNPGAEIRMSTSDLIHVHGAVVGDVAPITQEVRVHYDQSLATETPIQTATAVPRLTFLHVSVYRVDVENSD